MYFPIIILWYIVYQKVIFEKETKLIIKIIITMLKVNNNNTNKINTRTDFDTIHNDWNYYIWTDK